MGQPYDLCTRRGRRSEVSLTSRRDGWRRVKSSFWPQLPQERSERREYQRFTRKGQEATHTGGSKILWLDISTRFIFYHSPFYFLTPISGPQTQRINKISIKINSHLDWTKSWAKGSDCHPALREGSDPSNPTQPYTQIWVLKRHIDQQVTKGWWADPVSWGNKGSHDHPSGTWEQPPGTSGPLPKVLHKNNWVWWGKHPLPTTAKWK